MNANHILFSALAVTLISAYTMSPSDLLKHKSVHGRLPASVEDAKPEAKKDNVQCKSESKGETLEKDLKSLIEDKETLLKEIAGLKEKLSVKKPKTKEDNDSDTIALMSQMTSMLTKQMESQMQMQMQMMSFFAQVQFNQAPQYTMDLSQSYRPYGIHENFNMFDMYSGVGIPAVGVNSYSSPYSQHPQMSRQPAQQTDFGFSFGQIPQANNMRGFDFNLSPREPLLPKIEPSNLLH